MFAFAEGGISICKLQAPVSGAINNGLNIFFSQASLLTHLTYNNYLYFIPEPMLLTYDNQQLYLLPMPALTGGLINYLNIKTFVYEKATAFFQTGFLCRSGNHFVISVCSI